MHAIAISGSPSRESRSRRLLTHALSMLSRAGTTGSSLDLCGLPCDDLLGRARSDAIVSALDAVAAARLVIVGTPVYRASYSGLLKVFFDLLPQGALTGKVAIAVATGAAEAHQLVIDHALRPLLASVGALVVSTGVYGTDRQFADGEPDPVLIAAIDRAVGEALDITLRLPPTQR
jgi:FMN reductase